MNNPKIPEWIVYEAMAEPDFMLRIKFADGSEKRYDMKPVIADGGIFNKLSSPEVFSTAYADGTTVSWPCNVDIAPEELYEHGTSIS